MSKISLQMLSFIILMLLPIKIIAILGLIVALLGIRRLIQLIRWPDSSTD
jgi:hypothetical protein